MQCACVTLEGMPEPALHIPRWPLEQSDGFLNKRPQRGRGGHCGNEVGTLRRDRNIASQLHIQVPTRTSIALVGGPSRPYRPMRPIKEFFK